MDQEHHDQPARVIGRYALYGKLASGGMATVHFGRLLGPAGFSRTVAIKRLHPQFAKDPEFVAMFLDEARLAARIQHPNVVATVDVVALQEELFLVMDYIRGESFSRLMRASRKRQVDVSLGVIVSIISGMLHGLHAAHEARDERGQPLAVVHRDVSPQNVLVGVDGIARVLDFGVAKAAARIQITRDGQMKGKLSYMAPEQLQGKVVDRRTDVFAAGIVLWEALTGKRLFDAEEPSELLRMIVSEEIPPPSAVAPSITRSLDDIVMRSLSRDVTTRFQTAREFAIALEEAVPLASPREVGEWVELVAGDTLLHREQAVAEIEAVSQVSDVSFNTRSLPSFRPRISSTVPPPRTLPDATKPWDDEDDPTRISTSSIGSSTKRDKPTRIQVPRPRSSHPPPGLGPEHIGFGVLLDSEPLTSVVPPAAGDEARTSIYPPAAAHDLPSFPLDEAGSIPLSRAIVVRDRSSMPPTLVLAPNYPTSFRDPSMFTVAVGWLWDNPRQRTWRVAAAAGTVALLLGFGVAAGRGGNPKGERFVVVPQSSAIAVAPQEMIPRGIDPSTLPLADDERPRSKPSDVQTTPYREASETTAASRPRENEPAERPSAALERPSKEHPSPSAQEKPLATDEHVDLAETENPYSARKPGAHAVKPAAPASDEVTVQHPSNDGVSPGCRQPYSIDSQGIRRIKPECL
ncbi:MAG TPA: protein kinase [Polyangiaceae bacterium]|jgi:serine/threonine-protein kinase|nr:protein kinase [Polyangiaceae bacterium]